MEKKYRLKYMYHIDTDVITERIRKELDTQTVNVSSGYDISRVFYYIFQEIMHATKPYTQFILSDSPITHLSIFNEDPYDPRVYSSYILSSIVLFHHCVNRSLVETIDASTLSLAEEKRAHQYPYNQYEFLTQANHFKIRHGYYYNLKKTPVLDNNSKIETDYPGSYRRKYIKFSPAIPPEEYSEHYLRHRLEQTKDSNNSYHKKHLAVKTKFCNPALFLFKGPHVSIFDNELKKAGSDNFLINYQKLLESANVWKSDLEYRMDHLLFDAVIEPCYAFNMMPYLDRILTELTSETWKDKPIHGSALMTTIADHLLPVPVTYNKGILLQYAIEAIRSTRNIFCTYPEPDTLRAPLYPPTKPMPADIFAATALLYLGEYFRTIQHIVVPLIEDLWDVLTSDLKIQYEHFYTFVEHHWNFITYDYTLFPDDFFIDIFGREKYRNMYTSVLRHTIRADLNNGIDVNNEHYQPDTNFNFIKHLPRLYSFQYYYESIEEFYRAQSKLIPSDGASDQYHPESSRLLKMLFLTPAQPIKPLSDLMIFNPSDDARTDSEVLRNKRSFMNTHIGNLCNVIKTLT